MQSTVTRAKRTGGQNITAGKGRRNRIYVWFIYKECIFMHVSMYPKADCKVQADSKLKSIAVTSAATGRQ